jgi:inorganic phosphate transporter, PiT family
MVDAVAVGGEAAKRPRLEVQPNIVAVLLFMALLASGVLFAAYSLETDIVASGMPVKTWLPFLLLGVALLIALGFEFVNGFHDTANAVTTVIYTHSMPANLAVVWSGFFNFLGVLLSSGAVAFGIISLRPSSSFCRSAAAPALPWCSPC